MTKKLTDGKILKAIKGSGGIISKIAKRCGVEWNTVSNYINAEGKEHIREAYNAEKELLLDTSEELLLNSIKNPTVDRKTRIETAKYYLGKKGRNRGYGEKLDITTDGEKLNKITIEIIHAKSE